MISVVDLLSPPAVIQGASLLCQPTRSSVPRFYFDICDRDGYHRDEVGDDFEDFSQAQDQAHALLPDIARWRSFQAGQETIACLVRDGDGEVVYRGELIFRGTTPNVAPSRPGSNATTPC